MQTIMKHLIKEIPKGKYCNPDTSEWPKFKNDCLYHKIGLYCLLHEELLWYKKGWIKICEINE